MNASNKKVPIKAIPEGVWESSAPEPDEEKRDKNEITTDLQGNGYPLDKRGSQN